MGNATSSALRAEDTMTPAPAHGDDGPAFGSLANLGGPRKFKKKPVLVLDPEELEKAHMMFQEASAELLGEEVERHEKPKSILGLAPMDDEDATPEDMGDSDDAEAGTDDEVIPSAEDLLRMTEARAPIDPAMADTQDDYIAQQLESLDVDHRIFPSLPLKSEEEIAAEEEAERAAAQASAESEAAASTAAATDSPAPRIDFIPEDEPASPYVGPFENLRSTGREDQSQEEQQAELPSHAFPVNPLPEPEAEMEPPPEPEPQVAHATADSVFGDEPFLDFPTQPLRFVPEPEAVEQAVPEAVEETTPETVEEFAPEPVDHAMPEAEDNIAPEAEVLAEQEMPAEHPAEAEDPVDYHTEPEAGFELELHNEIDWDENAPLGLGPDYEPEPEPEPEREPDGSYTEVEDEPVDGYAFMYAGNPRARTLHALAEGESNSLRAKLLKERQDALAEIEAAERKASVWTRFTAWLRGLLG